MKRPDANPSFLGVVDRDDGSIKASWKEWKSSGRQFWQDMDELIESLDTSVNKGL